jgi:hypothetical protein
MTAVKYESKVSCKTTKGIDGYNSSVLFFYLESIYGDRVILYYRDFSSQRETRYKDIKKTEDRYKESWQAERGSKGEKDCIEMMLCYLRSKRGVECITYRYAFRDNENPQTDKAEAIKERISYRINLLKEAAKDDENVLKILNEMYVKTEHKVNDLVTLVYKATGKCTHYGSEVRSEHTMIRHELRDKVNKGKHLKVIAGLSEKRASCSDFVLTCIDMSVKDNKDERN